MVSNSPLVLELPGLTWHGPRRRNEEGRIAGKAEKERDRRLGRAEGLGEGQPEGEGEARQEAQGSDGPRLWTLVGRIPLEELGVEPGTQMESRAGDLSTN